MIQSKTSLPVINVGLRQSYLDEYVPTIFFIRDKKMGTKGKFPVTVE